jgi:hypothetical protein
MNLDILAFKKSIEDALKSAVDYSIAKGLGGGSGVQHAEPGAD